MPRQSREDRIRLRVRAAMKELERARELAVELKKNGLVGKLDHTLRALAMIIEGL